MLKPVAHVFGSLCVALCDEQLPRRCRLAHVQRLPWFSRDAPAVNQLPAVRLLQGAQLLSRSPCFAQVQQQLQRLRRAMVSHSLKPKSDDYIVARYNDPGTKPVFRRNEVLIELEDFQLW